MSKWAWVLWKILKQAGLKSKFFKSLKLTWVLQVCGKLIITFM